MYANRSVAGKKGGFKLNTLEAIEEVE